MISGGTGSRTGNPMFVDSSMRPSGTMAGSALSMLGGFKLRAGSPAINNGVAVTNNGGHDFWDAMLYAGAPDIGPHESP